MASDTSPTIKDIARAAGVTHQAVSIALGGRPGVSDERRQQIQRLAREMGYYPHASGQLLRRSRGRTGQWGLIIATDLEQSFTGRGLSLAVSWFVNYCTRHEQRYVIEYHPYEVDDTDFRPPHQVAGGLVDGSLVIGNVGAALHRWLDEQRGHPWVNLLEPASYCVLSMDHRAVAQTVANLAYLGHKRIACPNGNQAHQTHRLRRAGFRHAARRWGLTVRPEWRVVLSEDSTEHYQWARRVLGTRGRPTAVICPSETFARTVILAAAELGLRVPEDLSIVAWASPHTAASSHPKLTGVDMDWPALTGAAIDLLRQRINGRDDEITRAHRWVKAHHFDGRSIGAAPRTTRRAAEVAGKS